MLYRVRMEEVMGYDKTRIDLFLDFNNDKDAQQRAVAITQSFGPLAAIVSVKAVQG